MKGTLYVVATPIGNLEDLSPRALRTLLEVSCIYCENISHTKKLLTRHVIPTQCKLFGTRSGEQAIERVKNDLQHSDVALVSDAGTPTISDPGGKLIDEMLNEGFSVRSIPGPSSVTAALSISGVPTHSFLFLGFPPTKKGRKTFFESVVKEAHTRTVVFFESPHRLMKALEILKDTLPKEKHCAVVKEVTKIYENIFRGTAEEIYLFFQEHPTEQKGEFVIIVY